MRYCINCGNKLENECFCNNCGTDNGEVQKNLQSKAVYTNNMQQINFSVVLHWTAIIMFAIASLILLVECCKNAADKTAYAILYQGNCLFSVIYFVFGMWSVIPAILFILNGKNDGNKTVIGMAVIMIIIMVVLAVVYFIAKNASGAMGIIPVVFVPYYAKMSNVVVLEILAVVAGIAGMRLKQ